MTTPPTAPARPVSAVLPEDAAGVLAYAREQRAVADRAEAELLALAVQWALMHPAESVEDAEGYRLRSGGERVVGLAGPGAPLVAEFSVAELAAALGLGPEAGKYYLGHALELRYRLPRLWAAVMAGRVPVWKARRVADHTISHQLTCEAGGFVDQHLAPVAGRVKPAQLQRLVDEAIGRFMPEVAEETRRRAAEGRHFTIDHDQVSFTGTSLVTGELDLADALDLDDAIRAGAAALADLGSTDPLDVRRSLAVGELARRQLTLDLTTDPTPDLIPEEDSADPRPAPQRRTVRRPVRRTVLHLHLTDTALTASAGAGAVGRCENTRSPVTVDQIRDWCGHPATHLTVRPVLDLAGHVHVEAYEVPDRIREQVALRDHTCAFPWCTRPARALHPDPGSHGCDTDHTTPHDPDRPPGHACSQTCACRLAPLCRSHHRHKTHGGWSYTTPEPSTHLWRSPHGHHYLRDHTGTHDTSPPPRD